MTCVEQRARKRSNRDVAGSIISGHTGNVAHIAEGADDEEERGMLFNLSPSRERDWRILHAQICPNT